MERTAVGDDAIACPSCGVQDSLIIRWVPDIDHSVRERTELGCAQCDIWFSAKETKWAFAEWNVWACAEWEKKGQPVPHRPLYDLLQAEAKLEQETEALSRSISKYLDKNIIESCPWRLGDRFQSTSWPAGFWSVTGIKAGYYTNTGPIWLVTAREVRRTGRLGHTAREFAQMQQDNMHRLQPYWRPNRWSEVCPGDACYFNNALGQVVSCDVPAKKAITSIDGKSLDVTRLHQLRVPVVRVESGGT